MLMAIAWRSFSSQAFIGDRLLMVADQHHNCGVVGLRCCNIRANLGSSLSDFLLRALSSEVSALPSGMLEVHFLWLQVGPGGLQGLFAGPSSSSQLDVALHPGLSCHSLPPVNCSCQMRWT